MINGHNVTQLRTAPTLCPSRPRLMSIAVTLTFTHPRIRIRSIKRSVVVEPYGVRYRWDLKWGMI